MCIRLLIFLLEHRINIRQSCLCFLCFCLCTSDVKNNHHHPHPPSFLSFPLSFPFTPSLPFFSSLLLLLSLCVSMTFDVMNVIPSLTESICWLCTQPQRSAGCVCVSPVRLRWTRGRRCRACVRRAAERQFERWRCPKRTRMDPSPPDPSPPGSAPGATPSWEGRQGRKGREER